MSAPKTPLKHFNETVKLFLGDLKGVFDSNDREIIRIETAFELTSINARLFITPFQRNLLVNAQFVERIMSDDVDFFIKFDFATLIDADDEIYYTAPSSRYDEPSPTVDEQPPFPPEFKAIGRRLDRLAQAESTLRLALAQAGSASGGGPQQQQHGLLFSRSRGAPGAFLVEGLKKA